MIKLPTIFKKNGYQFKMIMRNEHFMICAQLSPENNTVIAYEVFKIKLCHSIPFDPNSMLKEITPSNNEWGNFSKTTLTLSKAKEYFESWTLMFNKKI